MALEQTRSDPRWHTLVGRQAKYVAQNLQLPAVEPDSTAVGTPIDDHAFDHLFPHQRPIVHAIHAILAFGLDREFAFAACQDAFEFAARPPVSTSGAWFTGPFLGQVHDLGDYDTGQIGQRLDRHGAIECIEAVLELVGSVVAHLREVGIDDQAKPQLTRRRFETTAARRNSAAYTLPVRLDDRHSKLRLPSGGTNALCIRRPARNEQCPLDGS